MVGVASLVANDVTMRTTS